MITKMLTYQYTVYHKKNVTKIDNTEDLDLVIPMYNFSKYSPNYSDMAGSLWLQFKGETTDFNDDIENTNDFKFFKWKDELLGSTEAGGANGMIGNTTIAFPLKYLNSSFRLLEMSLINCKVELKLKFMDHCVISGNDNHNSNSNNIIIKETIHMFLPLLYHQKTIKSYKNFLAKHLKDQCIMLILIL